MSNPPSSSTSPSSLPSKHARNRAQEVSTRKTHFQAWVEYNHTYTHAAPPAGDVGSVWNDGSDRWKPTLNASSSPEAEAQ